SYSVPPRHAIGTLYAHHVASITTQAQFGCAKESIHDVVRRTEAIVDQLTVALSTDHQERWQLPLSKPCRKLDIDLLSVINGAERLAGRIAGAECIPTAQALHGQPGIDGGASLRGPGRAVQG